MNMFWKGLLNAAINGIIGGLAAYGLDADSETFAVAVLGFALVGAGNYLTKSPRQKAAEKEALNK